MVASVIETYTLEQLFELDKSMKGTEKHNWVVNPPDPPGLFHEICSFIKGNINSSHGKNREYKSGSPKRAISILEGIFPILTWFRNYNVKSLRNDLIAGMTIASLCIPQSIGYAALAKLDPQYGLYTSAIPPLVYSLMGTSREIVIGPVAIDSLLLSSLIQQLVDPLSDPVSYRRLVFTATFFVGIFQATFGIFRLGFLVEFLSHAAVIGFMAGAAIIIGLQQLKDLFGISHFTNKTDIISVVSAVLKSVDHNWDPRNFLLGISFLCFILLTKFVGKRNKKLFCLPALSPLISFVLSTMLVFITKADEHGIQIVRDIKPGLNPISVHELEFHGNYVGHVVKTGLIVAVIGIMEAIAVGRSFASLKGYHIDANKEMVALGFMNIVGSFTSCYEATGSFSRTAVNFSAGCETGMSNIVMAVTVLLSLQLFTKLLFFTPKAILSSIILSALPGLINLEGAYHIWKVDKLDFLACFGAFCGVLFSNVEIGLIVAVMISFAKIVIISIIPGIEILGRLPGIDMYGDVDQYPMASIISGVLIIRVKSAWLCFANANSVQERIMRWVTDKTKIEDNSTGKIEGSIRLVVIDMSSLMSIDTSGIASLEELHKNLFSQGIELAVVNPRWQVVHKLRVANFVSRIGGRVFLTVDEAVGASVDAI